MAFASMRSVIAAAAMLFVAACAPSSQFSGVDPELAKAEAERQTRAAAEAYLRAAGRLHDVAFRIAAHNVELCGQVTGYRYGFKLVTEHAFERSARGAWRSVLGVDDRLTVLTVASGSPADRVGLRPGDKVIRVGDRNMGVGRRAGVPAPASGAPVEFLIERDGRQYTATITPAELCEYRDPVAVVKNDVVNAYAGGGKMMITIGMLRFAQQDEELALILGHELAHNTRGHMVAKFVNTSIGRLLGVFSSVASEPDIMSPAMRLGARMGASVFTQEFEEEADYVGVYHAARAGYDVSAAASFWRRMAVEYPQAINLAGSTHPSTAKRLLAVEMAVGEVADKRLRNLPLIPEER